MLLKSRSKFEIIDAAIEIHKRNFPTFFLVYLLSLFPFSIADALMENTANSSGSLLMGVFGIVLMIFSILAMVIAPAIVTMIASDTYLGAPKRELGQLLEIAMSKKWDLLKALITKWILITFGLVLLIVPGLFAAKRYFAIPATVILEGLPSREARSRSVHLSQGHGWEIISLYLILLTVVLLLLGIVVGIFVATGTNQVVNIIVQGIVGAAIYPIIDISLTVLYYNIRIKKEAFDLQVAAENLQ